MNKFKKFFKIAEKETPKIPVTLRKLDITWINENKKDFFEYLSENFNDNEFYGRKLTQFIL